MQRWRYRGALIALVLASAGCGGGHAGPAPAEPEAAVRSFLAGVAANSLAAMGEVWGSERGPAVNWMNREELDRRLTVMRIVLEHERYELVPGNQPVGQPAGERVVRVRLYRKGCTPVVPFTTLRYRSGWLVKSIDLEAAGNPARRCTP